MGISEWIPCFALLMCECHLLYLLNCFHLNSQVLIITLLTLFPQPTWGGVSLWVSVFLKLICQLGLNNSMGVWMTSMHLNYFSTDKCMLKSQSCCSKINLTFKTHSKLCPTLVFEGRKNINPKCICVLWRVILVLEIVETNKQINAGIYPIWS